MSDLRIADVTSRDVPLIVGFGGGVNSMAALVLLRRAGIRPDLVSFADTGGEKPETYAYLSVVSEWLARAGFPELVVVKNESPVSGDATLEASCVRRQTLPSRAFGYSSCAMRWKVEPQDKFLNHWPPAVAAWVAGKKPIKVLGYDGGEQRRASITETTKLRFWYPLLDERIDREGCVELLRSEQLPLPPKSACFFCPSSTKTEVLALRREHPDLFARAVAMEAGAAANEKDPLRDVKGLGRSWSWTALAAADDAQQKLFPEAPVESCVTCDDGDSCEAKP